MTRALAAIDAEILALDRRFAVAILNEAPDATRTRLYWERIALVREYGRAKELAEPERRRGEDRRKGNA